MDGKNVGEIRKSTLELASYGPSLIERLIFHLNSHLQISVQIPGTETEHEKTGHGGREGGWEGRGYH